MIGDLDFESEYGKETEKKKIKPPVNWIAEH